MPNHRLSRKRGIGWIAALFVAASVIATPAGSAGAWPTPLTQPEIEFLDAVRGTFPGDDDRLLLAGKQACRLLYTGQGTRATVDATAAQYGATRDQAARLVGAARATMCTQAPG